MKARWIRVVVMGTIGILATVGPAYSRKARFEENTYYGSIVIYNYAGVAPETMSLTEAVVSEIFKDAGIKIYWREIPLSGDGKVLHPSDPPSLRRLAYVKLLLDSKTPAVRPSRGALGCALGNQIYIFMDRLYEATSRANCPIHSSRPGHGA